MTMRYKQAPKGEVLALVPPMYLAGMTGVIQATQNRRGVVTLHYEDFTSEKAPLKDIDIDDIGFIDLVGRVQSLARRAEAGREG